MTMWLAIRLLALLALGHLAMFPALAAAPESIRTRLQAIEQEAQNDSGKALRQLDGMLTEPAVSADLQGTLSVQLARCYILAATKPAQARTLVETLSKLPAIGTAPVLLAKLRLCQAYAIERAGELPLAMQAYETAVEAGTRLRDDALLARARVFRGEQRAVQGRYGDAIDDLKAAYDIESRLGNQQSINYALNALANLYADRNVKDYANAMQAYNRLLADHERRGNLQGQATSHYNIGATLESQGDLEAALKSFNKALEIDRRRGAATDTAYNRRAVGIILSKLGRHDEGLALINQSLAHYQSIKDADGVAMVYLTRGIAHRRAARFELATADIDLAKAHYEPDNNPRFMEKIYDELALAAAGAKRWDRAYEMRGKHLLLLQMIQQGTLDERVARLRVQFQTEQALLQSRLLASENEKANRELAAGRTVARWQYAALALSVAAIAILGFAVLMQVRHGRRMRDLALTDELTRLPNRRHFMTVAGAAFANARAGDSFVALAAVDIDHFKKINDTFGHAAGDQVLQRAAHAMRCALRPGDTIGRTGGEEFLVLLQGATAADAINAAERIRQAVASVDCSDLGALAVRVSLGVTQMRPREQLDTAIQRADAALYLAKNQGRNRVVAS